MTYTNPTLITLNNTLHIKADNLEAVEVEQRSANEIMVLHLGYSHFDSKEHKNKITSELIQGIPLPQELSDRIEVRTVLNPFLDCADLHNRRAFLLPVKEVAQIHTQDWGRKQTYTIEEIEKAIEDYCNIRYSHLTQRVKEAIINNLKK